MPVRVRIALGVLGFTLLLPSLVVAFRHGGGAEEDEAKPGVVALASAGCRELEYRGEGDPDVLIASELTSAGPSRRASLQILEAIRGELDRRRWRAGEHRVAFQSCDDARLDTRDTGACRENAKAFAEAPTLVGVVGPYFSDCARIAVPILNTAPAGPIAMLSPLNVDVCLTEASPACDRTEPDKYYPVGTRNYARLAPHEVYQAAALAQLTRRLGLQRVFVLDDREAYGVGIAKHFRAAARRIGVNVVGERFWSPNDESYAPLFREVARADADAILLAGIASQDGARLIREKVAVLGSNAAKVKLLAPDGFAEQSLLDEAGAAARGLIVVAPGVALRHFGPPARRYAARLSAERLGGAPVDPFALHGAEAARILLDAVAGSDGTRSGIRRALFATTRRGGLLGSYEFNAHGDPDSARGPIVGFTVYRAGTRFAPWTTVAPTPAVVAEARNAGS